MPSAQVISARIDELRSVVEAFEAAGWDVSPAAQSPAALAIVDVRAIADKVAIQQISTHSLILIAIADRGAEIDCDDMIEWPLDRHSLGSVAAAWSLPSRAPLDRLAKAFGTGAFRPLVEGLRGELLAALGGSDLSPCAHRLAGLSGTLGFTSLSAALEAVSRGDTTLINDARRHAKTAYLAIDAWLATEAP